MFSSLRDTDEFYIQCESVLQYLLTLLSFSQDEGHAIIACDVTKLF